ncbi:hypothetical protein [Streptosporangium saharense]|uniref:C2H2-type domain-containing protein n=1 Tax=Streptosporangium saharense TaxID=1706840 RepID=A0A7W7VNL7_9ACTN|nr:hypothetical protein [Streptosporangium saharense]MBB4916634.1 hypothetical protein [Streptosporangium saharense]
MTEEFSTSETWPMECLRCWHVWQEEYVVRHLTDVHGHDVVVWLRRGTPVQPPWSGTSCPGCGHSRVAAFPPGSRPLMVPLALPEPAATVPALADERRHIPAQRPGTRERIVSTLTGQPALLYALLGIVFLLVTGFELVERVAIHH